MRVSTRFEPLGVYIVVRMKFELAGVVSVFGERCPRIGTSFKLVGNLLVRKPF
jgi:hypothetical protein